MIDGRRDNNKAWSYDMVEDDDSLLAEMPAHMITPGDSLPLLRDALPEADNNAPEPELRRRGETARLAGSVLAQQTAQRNTNSFNNGNHTGFTLNNFHRGTSLIASANNNNNNNSCSATIGTNTYNNNNHSVEAQHQQQIVAVAEQHRSAERERDALDSLLGVQLEHMKRNQSNQQQQQQTVQRILLANGGGRATSPISQHRDNADNRRAKKAKKAAKKEKGTVVNVQEMEGYFGNREVEDILQAFGPTLSSKTGDSKKASKMTPETALVAKDNINNSAKKANKISNSARRRSGQRQQQQQRQRLSQSQQQHSQQSQSLPPQQSQGAESGVQEEEGEDMDVAIELDKGEERVGTLLKPLLERVPAAWLKELGQGCYPITIRNPFLDRKCSSTERQAILNAPVLPLLERSDAFPLPPELLADSEEKK